MRLGGEDVAREGLQVAAEPGRDRDREALLAAADDLPRQQRRHRLAEQPLLGEAADLLARLAGRARARRPPGRGTAPAPRGSGPCWRGRSSPAGRRPGRSRGRGPGAGPAPGRPPSRRSGRDRGRAGPMPAAPPSSSALGLGREDLLPGVVSLERRQVRPAHEALGPVVEARLARGGRQQLDERPQERGGPADPRGQPVGHVGVVAAEELVAALARERHLDVVGRELRDEVGRERRRVGEGLVEGLDQPGQQSDRVRAQDSSWWRVP